MALFRFAQIRPRNAVRSGDFANVIEFDWDQSSSDWMIPNESYLAWDVSVTVKEGAAAVTALSGPLAPNIGLAQNAVATPYLFTGMRINDTDVSDTNDAAAASTLYKIATESRADQKMAKGVFTPISVRVANNISDSLVQTSSHKLNAYRAGASVRRFLITGKVPNPFWQSATHVPGGNRFQLRLNVSPFWYNGLAKASADAIQAVVSADVAADNRIHINVNDLALYCRVYTSTSKVPRGVQSIPIENWSTTVRAMNAGEDIEFASVRGTHTIFIAFLDNAAKTNPRHSLTDFCVTADNSGYPAADSGIQFLRTLYLLAGGHQYPSPQYSSLELGVEGVGLTGGSDNLRAYQEFTQACALAGKPTGTLLSYDEWLRTPIFGFDVRRHVYDVASTITIRYQLSQPPAAGAATDMLIMGVSSEAVELEYDDAGRVTRTEKVTVTGK